MIIRKTNSEELNKALKQVNKKYDNNIVWNHFEQTGETTFTVTLKCISSKKAGHRLGYNFKKNGERRNLISACWHVHGDFFDKLLNINESITIKARGKTINCNGGNWEDSNIGSMMNPLYYSEACNC